MSVVVGFRHLPPKHCTSRAQSCSISNIWKLLFQRWLDNLYVRSIKSADLLESVYFNRSNVFDEKHPARRKPSIYIMQLDGIANVYLGRLHGYFS